MFETVNDLIANKKIPALEQVQMLAPLQYVFRLKSLSLRPRVAKIVCRYERGHPKAFKPFLISTLPVTHHPIATAREVN